MSVEEHGTLHGIPVKREARPAQTRARRRVPPTASPEGKISWKHVIEKVQSKDHTADSIA
jgi:hypothetical protein